MCIQNTLQQHILDLTNNGEEIIEFFHATMRDPNAKTHHQLQAAIQLRKLGLDAALSLPTAEDHDESEDRIDTPSPLAEEDESRVPSPSGGRLGRGQNPPHPAQPVKSNPVTDLDIINYDIAHFIREETSDGYFIADFLSRVMRGAAGQGRPVSAADRVRAATELLNRGLGRFGDTRDRRISDSQEELMHSGLSRYIRERTDSGRDTARFLLEVASGQDQSFSMRQRVVATRELVHRGWDTNYEAVTPEDIAAYRERQEALEPTEHDIALREWRENESAALEKYLEDKQSGDKPVQDEKSQDEPLEEEPWLEAGLFAHLSFAEIARYDAMSLESRQKFVERQRQLRAAHQSAAAHPDLVPVISMLKSMR